MARGYAGSGLHHMGRLLPIRPELLRALGTAEPTPRPASKPPRKKGAPPIKADDPMTDAALASMRGDHELRGVGVPECALKYGITVDRARKLLGYVTRASVEAV